MTLTYLRASQVPNFNCLQDFKWWENVNSPQHIFSTWQPVTGCQENFGKTWAWNLKYQKLEAQIHSIFCVLQRQMILFQWYLANNPEIRYYFALVQGNYPNLLFRNVSAHCLNLAFSIYEISMNAWPVATRKSQGHWNIKKKMNTANYRLQISVLEHFLFAFDPLNHGITKISSYLHVEQRIHL